MIFGPILGTVTDVLGIADDISGLFGGGSDGSTGLGGGLSAEQREMLREQERSGEASQLFTEQMHALREEQAAIDAIRQFQHNEEMNSFQSVVDDINRYG